MTHLPRPRNVGSSLNFSRNALSQQTMFRAKAEMKEAAN